MRTAVRISVPFFCGGLVARHSECGEYTQSGQYNALLHTSHFIRPDAKIYPISVGNNGEMMHQYPKVGEPLYGTLVENTDGSKVLLLANHNDTKRQTQIFLNGEWWCIELLPDSVSTVVFEQ